MMVSMVRVAKVVRADVVAACDNAARRGRAHGAAEIH
jgi:hypothetical protein